MSQSKFEANACTGRLVRKNTLANQIRINHETNRPPPSSNNPHFQHEARCTTFLVKMSFICIRMKNDFHIKGWAPTLVLKQKPGVGNGLFWIHLTNQNSKQVHASGPKGGKTFWSISETQLRSDPINQSKLKACACSWRYACENVCKQLTIELLLLPIGWKSGAKCFSQSHYVAIQKQSNSELVSILSYPVVKKQWRFTKLMILSKLNLT